MLTLTMFSVITRCLGFIYKIYTSKIMTTTDLGIYNLTLSIYMVLITIVGSSIPLTISKITANNIATSNTNKTKYSVTSSLLLTTSISIVLSLLVLISKPLITLIIGDPLGYTTIVYLIPSVIFTAIYSQIRGYLWGIENYFSVSLVELIEQILRILFCIIFIYLDIFSNPIISVSLALSIACGISTIIGIYYYLKNGGKFKYKNGYYKEIIKSALPLTSVRLIGSIINPLISIIIPIQLTQMGLTRDSALSELGIITGMTLPLISIPSTIIGALCMILIPRINASKKDLHLQLNYYIKFTIACVFIFIPTFIALGIPICEFIFNNYSAGLYLQQCCIIALPIGLAQITTSILNALNEEKKSFLYYIISNGFMLISILFLTKLFYIKAMPYTLGISSFILFTLNLRKIKKITGYKSSIFKECFYHVLLCLPILVLTKILFSTLTMFLNLFLSLIICSFVSVIFYLIFMVVFRVVDPKIIKNYIFKNKQKLKINN